MSSQWGSQKLLQGLLSHELIVYLSDFDLFLNQWIMAILSKRHKSDNFESHNSLKLSFTSIRVLCLNFVECELFLESNSNDILALYKTNLDDSMILAISLWGIIFLKSKRILLFMCTVFRMALLHSVSYFFFLYRSPSLSLCMVSDAISTNIDKVSRSTHLLLCLSLETLTSIRRTS